MKTLRILRLVALGVATVAALMLLAHAVWGTPWFGKEDPTFILGLGLAISVAHAMAIHTRLKKVPIQPPETTRGQ